MKSLLTPVLIGRSEELSQLDAALAAVEASAGRCVLISGDAGIGKSRLIAKSFVPNRVPLPAAKKL